MNLEQAKARARKISKDEQVSQHVNKYGDYYNVEDWFDCDRTVASYEDGVQIS